MTLQDLNNILGRLSQNHNRDTVLEFAFALIEWMGIAPNAEKKPQLLSPQTQRLKDYLVPAPQTVQPQLYRLSADSQSVRVRFAVLKKLKKDYIGQLVDNDPGLTSYQAFSRNLTAGATAFIPSQPYFIHFVTTPDYDRLVLIFNQGDQKRILSFRNKLTHTQYNKIIEMWSGIASKPKPEIADLFWKSIDIKEVNKEFYKQIKERFDSLVGIAKAEGVSASENQLKQFAVRLIGRYIFCWFLKEKRIISHSLIGSEIIKVTPSFHQIFLQKLFFGTLNTRVDERLWLLSEDLSTKQHFEKIPYLNGGLFDKTTEDEIFASLDLNSWLINFVGILENYDFTVDESSSNYQLVAVDPEMLGRIFENLLASQNPETEKAANNERKAFGAFYTPRDIVDYMVNESLQTYLAKKLEVPQDDLSPAFSSNPQWPEKLNKRKAEAEAALQSAKILDPACGSGAFPMGVLHRLISLRELVGLQPDTYHLKKEILSNNIYGIDIMPMAVEIARLRAWLSLIVEEDYKGEKIASNFGIDALPNLDFKFMQGNSLLETYEGIQLFDEKLLETKSLSKRQEGIERVKKQIGELQTEYTSLHGTNKLKQADKLVLEKKLKENKDILNRIINTDGPVSVNGLFNEGEKATSIAERLKSLHKNLFSTSDKEQKKQFKAEIEALEWNLISSSLTENGKEGKLKDLSKLREQNIKPYFLFKLNFPEVFTEKKGFDIVIGNPPYVRQEAIDPYFKPLYVVNHPEVGSGTADLYVYFFDSALFVTNPGGVIMFITLNKYLKTKYGEGLRKKLKEKNVDLIIDFFELPVFEASTDTAITKIINAPDTDTTRYFPVKSLDSLNLNILTRELPLKVIKDGAEWKFVDESSKGILDKIYKSTISLQEFTSNRIYRGITTGDNRAFIIENSERDEIVQQDKNANTLIKKFISSTSIKKYENIWTGKWLIFTRRGTDIEKYAGIKKYLLQFKTELEPKPANFKGNNWQGRKSGSYKWYEIQDNIAYYKEFEQPKIVYIHTAKNHEFYLDTEQRFINNSCYCIISDNKFLFFFLNSILFDWFKRIKFVAYGDADEAGRVKLDYNKMITVPIKLISKDQLLWFEQKYDEIKKSLTVAAKVKQLENEVETRLFKLYDLNYSEVKSVCPAFWMSAEEYERYRIEK